MEWRSLIQGQILDQTVPLPSTYGGNFGSTLTTVPTAVSPAILAQYAADGLTPGQPFPNNTILGLNNKGGRSFIGDVDIGIGREVLLCQGEVAGIDDHSNVRAAVELVGGIDRIVKTLVEVSAKRGSKVRPGG